MVAHEIRQDAQAARYPRRYAGIRPRNQRIGRPLRAYARIGAVDEELLDRIGRRMFARDEVGADLVRAMRRPRTDAERVSMAQFHRALEHGIDAVPEAPEALRRFFAVVDDVPEWVDFDLLEKGARAFRRMGRSRIDVLLQLSLIGGYRFGGPPDLLVETGGPDRLDRNAAPRRNAEMGNRGRRAGRDAQER